MALILGKLREAYVRRRGKEWNKKRRKELFLG
jgi:hypothetical protein